MNPLWLFLILPAFGVICLGLGFAAGVMAQDRWHRKQFYRSDPKLIDPRMP